MANPEQRGPWENHLYGAARANALRPIGSLAELRRQQADFHDVRAALDRKHELLAVPALAPVAAVAGLEAGAAVAGRVLGPAAKRAPIVLTGREPHLRVGDNWATRIGRRAHSALKAKVRAKTDWKSEPTLNTPDGPRRPDVLAPLRKPIGDKVPRRNQMELKPNTPSGQRAGRRSVLRYKVTGHKTRVIYYDPDDFR